MFERMQRSRNNKKKKQQQQQQQQLQTRCSKAFCATCRLNDLSSPEEGESSNEADEVKTVSSIAHAMVQVRLDQMIRERKEGRSGRRRRTYEDEDEETKLVVVVAMEKSSYDPREDFRESMEEIIVANRIQETKDLRRLLNYYMSMNSEEFRGTILEVFHQVCSDLFLKYF